MSLLTLKQAGVVVDPALEKAISAGKLLPQQGGMLIRCSAGAVLGAVGISGASAEEACGAHGAEKAGLKPEVSG